MRQPLLLHNESPALRISLFNCLSRVEHALSLQEMLKVPRRLSTDRLVRSGRHSLHPYSMEYADLAFS